MGAVFRCDLCRQVNDLTDVKTEYCTSCALLIMDIKITEGVKADNALRDQYGTVIRNQVHTVELLRWLRDEQADDFTHFFGTQGLDKLDRALQKE